MRHGKAWQGKGHLLTFARPMRKTGAILLFCLAALAVRGAPPPGEWQFEGGEVDFQQPSGLVVATNGVKIRYAGATLIAQRALVNQKTGKTVAEGEVRIEHEGQVWAGERIEYNFLTHKMVSENFKAGQNPFFVRGDLVVGDEKANIYVGVNGEMTTDDYADPGFRLRAKKLIIAPGDYIEAYDAVVYVRNVPVFYYPWYRRSLKTHPNNFVFVPGYRSLYGPFLLTSYNWYWNEQLDGTLHLDLREKRGVGIGPDFNYKWPGTLGIGTFKSYYTYDKEPGVDFENQPIDNERWRLWYTHQAVLRTNLTAKVAVRWQSDSQVIRDFFESEYRKNVEPSTFAEVDQLWSNYSLNLLGRVQVNPFFETVERLPDLKLSGVRQQIGGSPLYYETENSVAYLSRRIPTPGSNDFQAFRADTYHQVTLPHTFFGWMNIAPRVGGRFTHYGQAEGNGARTTEEDRAILNTGAELTFKASALWPAVSSRFWEVDGLRHIVEPSLNYVFVPRPTVPPTRLPQFDYEVPSTRLLPIEFPDYNSIDSIDSQNVMRIGFRNRLQTKRKLGVDNIVNWALYTDWRIHPYRGQRTFSDVYSDLDVKPFSWLLVNSELRYDVDQKFWREANHSITVTPGDRWSFSLGHRYLREIPGFGPQSGDNLIYNSVFYRLNENWGFRTRHYYNLQQGVMQEQQYTVYRDLRSWTVALSFRVRESQTSPTDYAVAFTASLKAFPRFDLGQDANNPALLLGY